MAPTVIEIDSVAELEREVFGPVLRVVRYRRDRSINCSPTSTRQDMASPSAPNPHRRDHPAGDRGVCAGNVYVTCNLIGAALGVQPFGGHERNTYATALRGTVACLAQTETSVLRQHGRRRPVG